MESAKQLTSSAHEDQVSMNSMFSTRRPKDAAAGLSSGLQSISKGVLGGIASLVALPVYGAQTEGAAGFVKGLGLGLISAVAMTVAGTTTGVVQIGRGIINTPGSLHAKMSEKVWDEDKRIWFDYNLPNEAADIGRLEQEAKATAKSHVVSDSEFYDRLAVLPSATQAEIKKAYRQKAILLHPDKNPNDSEASAKFQAIGAAYQVLSNPQLRASYDLRGKEGVDQNALLDSAHLFEVIFGSQRFESYVGELQLLSMQESAIVTEVDSEKSQFEFMKRGESKMKLKTKKREVQCATNLALILDRFLSDKTDGHLIFQTEIKNEAKELSSTAFGGTLIGVIVFVVNKGYVYEEQAMQYLGFKKSVTAGLGVSNFSQSAHIFASKYRVLSSAVKMYQAAKQEQSEKNKGGDQKDPQSEIGPKSIGSVIETLWNYTVVDVESTLRSVCQKLLKDTSVSLEVRVQRAEGLLILGQIFNQMGKSAEAGLSELEKTFVRPHSNI